jgi:hypothetical protein
VCDEKDPLLKNFYINCFDCEVKSDSFVFSAYFYCLCKVALRLLESVGRAELHQCQLFDKLGIEQIICALQKIPNGCRITLTLLVLGRVWWRWDGGDSTAKDGGVICL